MPTARDFAAGAVDRAVRKEALQHPLTVLPAAGAGVGALALMAFGAGPIGTLVTLGLGFLAAASWGFHYILHGERRAAAHVARLRELRRRCQRQEVERIAADCEAAGFAAGQKEARELTAAWEQLVAFLDRRLAGGQDHDGPTFRALAEDALNEGLGMLRQALAIFEALRSIDIAQLERELAAWQRQAGRPGQGDQQALLSQIAVQQQRIDIWRQRQERLGQLLAEVNRLAGALETTWLQATELAPRDDPHAFGTGRAAAELERAVAAARRTEERLRELEGSTGADEAYLEAARTTRKPDSRGD